MIFSWEDEEESEVNSVFPANIYKLMLFYEQLEGFHHLYKWENYEENRIRIISECLSYSLLISNPLLAIYLANTYPDEVFDQKDTIIDGILHYLNEFTELNGSIRYRYFFNILSHSLHIIIEELNT